VEEAEFVIRFVIVSLPSPFLTFPNAMLRSLYPILLLYATFTTRSLATPPQFPFSLSPLPSSDPLLKFSFPSLSSLHLALQEHSKLDTDIWYTGFNDSSNQYELILVQPSPLTLTTSLLSSPLTDNIPQETLIPSISSHLAQPTQDPEYLSQISFNSRRNFSNEFLDSLDSSIHDTYHPFQGLQEILGTIEGRWGSDWVKRESLGQSYEGRRIEVIKVSDYRTPSSSSSTGMEEDEELEEFVFVGGKRNKGEKEKKDKIGIVVYGAQHAREWITSSTILYLVHSLLVGSGAHTIESEGGDKLTRELLKRVEFTFIPVVNVRRSTLFCTRALCADDYPRASDIYSQMDTPTPGLPLLIDSGARTVNPLLLSPLPLPLPLPLPPIRNATESISTRIGTRPSPLVQTNALILTLVRNLSKRSKLPSSLDISSIRARKKETRRELEQYWIYIHSVNNVCLLPLFSILPSKKKEEKANPCFFAGG